MTLHCSLYKCDDAFMSAVKKVEPVREAGRWRRSECADMADISPLWGAGAKGPSAVIHNRTSLLARTKVPPGFWMEHPWCRRLVSVLVEGDKYITLLNWVWVVSFHTGRGERFWEWLERHGSAWLGGGGGYMRNSRVVYKEYQRQEISLW